MSAYRTSPTRLVPPASHPRQGGSERVNGPSGFDFWAHGRLKSLGAREEITALGQTSRQRFQWRGRLPDGCEPDPGWEIRIATQRWRVVRSMLTCGGWWELEVELME